MVEPPDLVHAPQAVEHLLRRHGKDIEKPQHPVGGIAPHKAGDVDEIRPPEDVDDIETTTQKAAPEIQIPRGTVPADGLLQGIAPVGLAGRGEGGVEGKALLGGEIPRQDVQALFQAGVERLHIIAPGVGAVDTGHVIFGYQGEEQARGVGIALDPLGILPQGVQVGPGEHFHQKIPAGGAENGPDVPVAGQVIELPGADGAAGRGEGSRTDAGRLPDDPAPLFQMAERALEAGEVGFLQPGRGGAHAHGAPRGEKGGIDHGVWAPFVKTGGDWGSAGGWSA